MFWAFSQDFREGLLQVLGEINHFWYGKVFTLKDNENTQRTPRKTICVFLMIFSLLIVFLNTSFAESIKKQSGLSWKDFNLEHHRVMCVLY